jgi:hypothetical protein
MLGVYRPRLALVHLAFAVQEMLPSDSVHIVGARDSFVFAAQYPAYTCPCQRFTPALTNDGA